MNTRTYSVPMYLPVGNRRITRTFTLIEDPSSIYGWRQIGPETITPEAVTEFQR